MVVRKYNNKSWVWKWYSTKRKNSITKTKTKEELVEKNTQKKETPKGYAKVQFKSNIEVNWKVYKKWVKYELPIRFMQTNWMCQLVERRF